MFKTIFSVLAAISMLLSGIFGGVKQQSGMLQSSSEHPGIYEFHFYHNDLDQPFSFKW